MIRLGLVLSALLFLSGCTLRPRYADFVSPSTKGEKVTFLLAEKDSGRPLPNVQVEMSELRSRVRVTTAPDGTFSLPVDARYVKENPVIVVSVPRGVGGYQLTVVTAAPPPPAPAPVSAPPEAPEAPTPAAPEAPAPPAPSTPAPPPANG